jgi:hypothetical protein
MATARGTIMTTSMPTGAAAVSDGPTRSEVDGEAAPTTGMEPDTAADAAGETDAPVTADATAEVIPNTHPETGSTEPADDDELPAAAAKSTVAGVAADRTVLDGPALENEEMHRATDDLRSSEEKTAAAREFADELAKTQPRDA